MIIFAEVKILCSVSKHFFFFIYIYTFPITSVQFFVQWIDLGSKKTLQLAHSRYQDTKIFGTKVWGGSLDLNITTRQFCQTIAIKERSNI